MLPTIVAPTYEVKLHSLPKPVKYRPYLVKEEKILLMAQQGGDAKEVERAVKQIIQNCTFNAINVDALPSFDVELLFLQLRAKSVNNVVELRYECKNIPTGQLPIDNGVCGNIEKVPVNLDEITLYVPPEHTNKIMITDTMGVTLRYPTTEHVSILSDSGSTDALSVIASCVQTIFMTDGTVYEASDSSPEEMQEFVESLSLAQAEKFRGFFETMPSLTHIFQFKCSKCGYTENITLTGLMDFFG